MNKWELTGEAFDLFLNWLDTDREQAGQKYEALRRRLVIFFNCRGCAAAEDLADQAINRVIKQTPTLAGSLTGDPARYFYGVAKNLHHEYLREQAKRDGGPVPEEWPDPRRPEEQIEAELIHKCLRQCLQKLPPDKRETFQQYYQVEKRGADEQYQALAVRLDCTINALRIRVHRLKNELRACITACRQRGASS